MFISSQCGCALLLLTASVGTWALPPIRLESTAPPITPKLSQDELSRRVRECLALKGRSWNAHSWEYNYEWDGCFTRLIQDHKTGISAIQEDQIRRYLVSLGYYKWSSSSGFSNAKKIIKPKDVELIAGFINQAVFGVKTAAGLTLSSTRTPPALPSALSQPPASPSPLIVSVQAGPVTFLR